jgi:hypothetical protein
MNPQQEINLLNRLMAVLGSSLPTYLDNTASWADRGAENARALLARIASDQQQLARRTAAAVRELGGLAAPGRFPIGFTATNDLSANYLVKKTAVLQTRDVEIIRQVVDELAESPRLQALAEDVLGRAKQHLADLEALAGNTSPT